MTRGRLLAGGLLVLLAAVVAALTPTPATAQAQQTPTACRFTKAEAIDANGGPLGDAIWGRLCQVRDGKAQFPTGVRITVRQGGEVVGRATTKADGVFIVEVPGSGTYSVSLDPDTLPDGFSLTDDDRATLERVQVRLGDQQAVFRLGEDRRGERDLADYATSVAKGVRLGLILAVAAVGLSLVFGVTGLVNFAHAELVTFGGMVAYGLNRAGIPIWVCVPLTIAIGAAFGWSHDRAVWRPLRRRRMALLSMMVVSIGLSTALRNVFQIQFGVNGRRYDVGIQRQVQVGPIRMTPNDWVIIAICLVVIVLVTLLLRRTRLGTAIRAVADNPDLAASSGIPVERVVAVVWMLSGGLAALGGILYGLTVNVKFDMGLVLLLSMFAAVVLGGLGSAYGAVLGAVVIGTVQETSGLFVDTAYKFVVALLVLVLVLIVRPQGILGRRQRFG